MEEFIVREALPEDAAALLACMKQIGGETDNLTFGAEGLPFTVEEEKSFLQSVRNNTRSIFLCAWKDDALVGTGTLTAFTRRMSHRAELSVSVMQSQWGQGIGSRLMERLIAFACAQGIEILSLEVRSDNAAAIHLYKKYGFRCLGTFPGFFKIGDQYADFQLMYLDLR